MKRRGIEAEAVGGGEGVLPGAQPAAVAAGDGDENAQRGAGGGEKKSELKLKEEGLPASASEHDYYPACKLCTS